MESIAESRLTPNVGRRLRGRLSRGYPCKTTKRARVLDSIVEGRKRLLIAIVLAAVAVILSSVAISFVLLERAVRVEIAIQDVALLADRPAPGQTELHVYLIVRNLQPSAVAFDHVALWAWDPKNGTLFDTYVHTEFDVKGNAVTAFSEVSTLNGKWSEVVFKVRILTPTGWWESAVTPDHSALFVR